jgi:predicted nucleic acid-binding protein
MIVLDASAAVELLLNTPRAVGIAARLAAPMETMHVPQLLSIEVASALRVLEARKQVSSADAARALVELLGFGLIAYAHEPLVARVWQLRGNLTAYDAVYIALAEHLVAPLITCDARLAAAPGHHATIELFV